ncbi:hypothetical protein C4J81_18900 (plasmid) [Deltaproteobacteria bacterium Smac51]|nr:hypothetical protein C4J81_18900 [Deltaproteobacteria bacterium Smac51]
MAANEDNIILETYQAEDGALETLDNLGLKDENPTKDVEYDPRPVLPVLFLPGLMASNIEHKKHGMVWEPGNTLGLLSEHFFEWPASRQAKLDPNMTFVSENGSINIPLPPVYRIPGMKNKIERIKELYRVRKWGTVMSSFHQFMYNVESLLNQPFDRYLPSPFDQWGLNELRKDIRDVAGLSPSALGGQAKLKKVEMDEIKDICGGVPGQHNGLRFEIWGGGYNWLESNEASAKKIAALIKETIIPHYAKAPRPAKKILLVTHSMGGFVARFLMQDASVSDRIIGVVHGAMPANGAADTYVRARRGTSGEGVVGKITARVLGNNAEHMTRVLSQAVGPMELLPFGDSYNMDGLATGKVYPEKNSSVPRLNVLPRPGVWLRVAAHGTQREQNFPGLDGDIYTSVYKSRKWYGLIPDCNVKYVNQKTMPASVIGDTKELPASEMFDQMINQVEILHGKIRSRYHSETYAAWAAAAGDYETPTEVYWHIKPKIFGRQAIEDQIIWGGPDNGRGKVYLNQPSAEANLIPLVGRGDQTVPQASWWGDLKAPGILGYFIHGFNKPGQLGTGSKSKALKLEAMSEGYVHQDSFFDPRSLYFTLYSIIKIVHPKIGNLP